MEYAYIKRNHRWDEDKGEVQTSCQWVGRNRVAQVSPVEAMRYDGLFKNDFVVGGLRLRIVDTDEPYLIVTRDIWLAPVYKVIYRFVRSLEMIYLCFIVILSIWKLADCYPGAIPTWRDIKVLRWLAERLKE